MDMKPLFAALTVGLLATGLSACSSWMGSDDRVVVSEVNSSSLCNAPGEASQLTLLKDGAAVKAWESSRGVSLTGATVLPVGPYVVVDLGVRSSGGYGIAVSRQAGMRKGTLTLSATVFEPAADAMSTQALTSPCALVRLPVVDFQTLKLIDQRGKVRATLAVGAP